MNRPYFGPFGKSAKLYKCMELAPLHQPPGGGSNLDGKHINRQDVKLGLFKN